MANSKAGARNIQVVLDSKEVLRKQKEGGMWKAQEPSWKLPMAKARTIWATTYNQIITPNVIHES